MSSRDYLKMQIDTLPEDVIEKIVEFISFQKFCLGMYESDSDYLSSIAGMTDTIKEGMGTAVSECVPLSEVWPDV